MDVSFQKSTASCTSVLYLYKYQMAESRAYCQYVLAFNAFKILKVTQDRCIKQLQKQTDLCSSARDIVDLRKAKLDVNVVFSSGPSLNDLLVWFSSCSPSEEHRRGAGHVNVELVMPVY